LFKLDIDSALRRKVIFGDPTRLTQIIFNLTSNAIKFTAVGSVWVRVTCIEDRHNNITVSFSVKDTGIGIKKENLESIFEPFTQESITTTRQYGGTGLGLAIVKRLLELQGVKMHVHSVVNQGSEFSFNMEFPVSTEAIAPPAKTKNAAIRARDRHFWHCQPARADSRRQPGERDADEKAVQQMADSTHHCRKWRACCRDYAVR
jgi:hypothetical protein